MLYHTEIQWVPVSDRLPDVNKKPAEKYEVAHVIATDGIVTFPVFFERTVLKKGPVYRWHLASGPIYFGESIVAWANYPAAPKIG